MGGIDRRRANGRRQLSTESCRTCTLPDEKQYRSLVRLAALLTGDADLAEAVAADALAALPKPATPHSSREHCLTGMQRQVVQRSRDGFYNVASEPTQFAQLPVIAALRRLRPHLREAVVLTYYLDLPAAKAAQILGISEEDLRSDLAAAMRVLDDQIAGL
jgi:hypothetical protein